VGALLMQSAARAQQSNRASGPIFQHDLPEVNLHGWSVTAVEVKYAPGSASNAHRHPGITFAYVLEGEIVSKVGDDPEKTYGPARCLWKVQARFTPFPVTQAPPSPRGCWPCCLLKKARS